MSLTLPHCQIQCLAHLCCILASSHCFTMATTTGADTGVVVAAAPTEVVHMPALCRVLNGSGIPSVSKTGTTGMGTVWDFGTPQHTVYLYHSVVGINGLNMDLG